MAAGTRPSAEYKSHFHRNIDLGAAQALPSPAESMASVMPYSYFPPTSQNGVEMGGHHGGYAPPFNVLPGQPTSALDHLPSHDPSIDFHDQRGHLSPNGLQLRPLPSTTRPQVDGSIVYPGEKRKNRLGYQRTVTACGHCRKRKIRCIPNTDTKKPCSSCDRLKKECSYYPVSDGPAVVDPRSRLGSRASVSMNARNPTSPDPPTLSKVKSEPYLPLVIPAVAGVVPPVGRLAEAHMFTPESRVPSGAPSPGGGGYEFPGQPSANWMSGSESIAKAEDPNSGLRPAYLQDPSLASTFASQHPNALASDAGWHAPSDYDHPDTMSYYPTASRSLSFSSEPSVLYPARTTEGKSISSEMYPGAMPGAVPGSGIDPNMPLSAGAVPPQHYGAWPPQPAMPSQQYGYPKATRNGYQNWYVKSEPGATLRHDTTTMPATSAEGQSCAAAMYYNV